MGRREKRYQPRSANDLAGRANLASALRAERQLLAGGSSGGSQVRAVRGLAPRPLCCPSAQTIAIYSSSEIFKTYRTGT